MLQPSEDTSSQRPPAKRRKIGLACSSCRGRKTKCDAQRPVCSTCRKRGASQPCFYAENVLPSQSYVLALEKRLRRLEQGNPLGGGPRPQVEGSEPEMSTGDEAMDLATSQRPSPGLGRWSHELDYHTSTLTTEKGPGHSLHQNPRLEVSANDARGASSHSSKDARSFRFLKDTAPTSTSNSGTAGDALATTSPLDGTLDCLYGASSTIAFVRHIFRSTNGTHLPRIDYAGPPRKSQRSTPSASSHVMQQPQSISDLNSLPKRRIADQLLKSFWAIPHPVFPVLHRPTFEMFYESLWLPDSPGHSSNVIEDPTMMSILNIVFAAGCLYGEHIDPRERTTLADQFYQRSRRLVPLDALDAVTLPVVQLLLLTTIYLQATTYESRCWNTAGLAIRSAQSLGLHLDQRTADANTQLKRETRRRVWHVCVTLDRLLSMVYGRPTMIAHSEVPLPLPIDDENLPEDGEGRQPANLPSYMDGFVCSLRLFNILHEVLSTFYSPHLTQNSLTEHEPQARFQQGVHDILRINSKLDACIQLIPQHVLIHKHSEGNNDRARTSILQAKVLHSRFHYIRLLLLRPVVLTLVHEHVPVHERQASSICPGLEQEVGQRMFNLCLRTAHTLISLLHEDLDTVYRNSIAYSIYFTFGAAIIITASQLCSELIDETNKLQFESSFSLAMAIFRRYSPDVPSAGHAIDVLKTLRTSVCQNTDQAPSDDRDHIFYDRFNAQPDAGHNESEYRRFATELQFQCQNWNPDPLTEEWFSQQVVNLDFQELF